MSYVQKRWIIILNYIVKNKKYLLIFCNILLKICNCFFTIQYFLFNREINPISFFLCLNRKLSHLLIPNLRWEIKGENSHLS